jgi:tetratricopeptide (TPR) repeat protein
LQLRLEVTARLFGKYTIAMIEPTSLDLFITRAKKLAQENDLPGAMALAETILVEHPDEIKSWLLRSYLHELSEDYTGAERDLTQAVRISPTEPHLYYTRGRMHYLLGRFTEAADDFREGLALCSFHNNDYYRDELYFWSGATQLKLGDTDVAAGFLERLPDDFGSWTDRFQTKQDLLNECK